MNRPLRLSLVEALTLFLMLGIFASLAVPLRQQTIEAAGLTKCRSNLYEIGAASFLYASENGGRLPGNYDWTSGEPVAEQGTLIQEGRMYGILVTPEVGGYGPYDYLGRVHPLFCPDVAPEVYEFPLYSRPEEIHSGNPIRTMGYWWIYRPYGRSPIEQQRANDTVFGNPHNPLVFDFGPLMPGTRIFPPSHREVMNVLHLRGHVTIFPLDHQAVNSGNWNALYDAMRENSASVP